MFGKKKNKPIRVMHYEGIQGFPTNYPCELIVENNSIIIRRRNQSSTVTLPLNRTHTISAIGEYEFMRKYHSVEISHANNQIAKHYLIIEYDNGMIALWGTKLSAFKQFLKMQELSASRTSNIEL